MKSNKSRQQPLQTARWAPRGRRGAAAPQHRVAGPSPTHRRQHVQPGTQRPGCGQTESRRRRRAPLRTSRSLGGTRGAAPHLGPKGDPGSEASRRQCLAEASCQPSVPTWWYPAGCSPLAPHPHPRSQRDRRRAPTWGRRPAPSPLAAASSAAAIAGAVGRAPQPQGRQHGEPGARSAPAQVATWSGDWGTRAPPGAAAAATAAPGRAASAECPPRAGLRSMRTGPPAGPGAGGSAGAGPARGGVTAAPPRQPRGWRQSAASWPGGTSRLSGKPPSETGSHRRFKTRGLRAPKVGVVSLEKRQRVNGDRCSRRRG